MPPPHRNTPAVRDRFLLRPGVVFLNHGSFGACPVPVFEAYQRWQRELEGQPVEFLGRRSPELLRAARTALGAFVGADPDDLVYVPNATAGVNAVARSLELRPGDEVVGTDHEYGAEERTWQAACAERGARYVRAAVPVPVRSRDEVVEQIWSAVTPRTRVLAVSHITSPTALILPVGELIGRARAEGILTVIDGAHAPGQIPLDLRRLGADFYAANCHKWMCAPKGTGFLFARADLKDRLRPPVTSWGDAREAAGPSHFLNEFEWQGTEDISRYLAVPEAIRFLREHDWEAVRAGAHLLVRRFREAVARLAGSAPLCPDDEGWYAQMASMPLPVPVEEAPALQRRLYDEFAVEIPLMRWNGRTLLRISVQAYNTAGDVDMLLRALERVLR